MNEKNLGPSKNFWRALSLCKSDYVAFCDQDDTWDKEKLSILMSRMISIESESDNPTPILVYSDLNIVDENLNVMSNSFFKTTGKYPNCSDPRDFIVSNHIPGCAMLMNRALIDRAGALPDGVRMHDWWIALVASLAGKMSYVERPLVNYRQHANNAVGAPKRSTRISIRSLIRWLSYARRRAEISNAMIEGVRDLVSRQYSNSLSVPHWTQHKIRIRDRIYIALNSRSGERRSLSIAIACLLK